MFHFIWNHEKLGNVFLVAPLTTQRNRRAIWLLCLRKKRIQKRAKNKKPVWYSRTSLICDCLGMDFIEDWTSANCKERTCRARITQRSDKLHYQIGCMQRITLAFVDKNKIGCQANFWLQFSTNHLGTNALVGHYTADKLCESQLYQCEYSISLDLNENYVLLYQMIHLWQRCLLMDCDELSSECSVCLLHNIRNEKDKLLDVMYPCILFFLLFLYYCSGVCFTLWSSCAELFFSCFYKCANFSIVVFLLSQPQNQWIELRRQLVHHVHHHFHHRAAGFMTSFTRFSVFSLVLSFVLHQSL